MEQKERESGWYDDAYSAHLTKKMQYSLSPECSMYYKMWMRVIDWIKSEERIIDFGCGVGQFAELCLKHGKKYVYGMDFSKVAIDAAKIRNHQVEFAFFVKDLRDPHSFYFTHYDVAVLCEVLEHIEFDREVLQRIPSGKRVIISLPNYMCNSHVRCFADGPAISERYADILKINSIGRIKMTTEKCIWICDCKRI